MNRRFVILVDDATDTQQNTVTTFLKDDPHTGYWHWFSDAWLVTDSTSHWQVGNLRDKIIGLLPGAHVMVLQIDGENTWSGFGPTKMFEWLNQYWSN